MSQNPKIFLFLFLACLTLEAQSRADELAEGVPAAAPGAPAPAAQIQGAPAARELLEEAKRFEAAGFINEATRKYMAWFDGSRGADNFANVLMQAAGIQINPEEALYLLKRYSPAVLNAEEKATLVTYQAGLLEMLGRIDEAAALYQETASSSRNLYEDALLLYAQGRFEEAEAKLKLVLSRPIDLELSAGARHILARVYTATGRKQDAETIYLLLVEAFSDHGSAPVYFLSYFEFLIGEDRRREAEKLLQNLEIRFADSPEYTLARQIWQNSDDEAISFAPSPRRLLAILSEASSFRPEKMLWLEAPTEDSAAAGAEAASLPPEPGDEAQAVEAPEQEIRIQTGAFRVVENAQYMVRDLKQRGFRAQTVEKLIRGTKYFRVVIGPVESMEEAQSILIRLKDSGFEGMLLFED